MRIMLFRNLKYLTVCLLFGCTHAAIERSVPVDNELLIEMVIRDQQVRSPANDSIDLETVDRQHRQQVFELLSRGQIRTAKDKFNAALILQHTGLLYCDGKLVSISPENYLLAHQLANSAMVSGSRNAGYLAAATYDRYLLYTKGFQKYGTQRLIDDKTGEEMWAPIDPSTTDAERTKYQVPGIDSLKKKYRMMEFDLVH